MLLRELTTEYVRHKIFHYGADGNKVVRHYFEMQHVAGVLYKGREEPDMEYTNEREIRCNLYVVFPETNTGLILEKGIRLYRKAPDYAQSEEGNTYDKEYNDYLDSIYNTDHMMQVLSENGMDSLEHYLERQRRLKSEDKWIGMLDIEFVRQVDTSFADELAAYRLAYKARRAERDEARRKELQEQEDERIAKQNAETEEQIREAEAILLGGGDLKNFVVIFRKKAYDCKQYSIVNYLMRKYGIEVPLRTQGWIANSLVSATITGNSCTGCTYHRQKKTQRGSQAVFKYHRLRADKHAPEKRRDRRARP